MPKDDSKLTEYVLGILDKDAREEVEGELGTSPEIREELRAIEEALGSVALAEEPVRPSQRVRELLLASVDPRTRFDGFVDRLVTFLDLGVERVRELLDAVATVPNAPWQESGLPGARLLHFDGGPRVATADCGLVHMEPGLIFPKHRHLGNEWALILQGRSQEDSGLIAEPGDIIHKPQGSEHSFRVLGDEPFVFVIVLHGGIEIS